MTTTASNEEDAAGAALSSWPEENVDLLQEPAILIPTYVRHIPQAQNCEPEKMITIESISLRRGGWRNTDGFLNDLRHIDSNLGTLIFYGVVTAVLFYLYWKSTKSMTIASLYTTSSLCVIALSFGAIFGLDFFGALGVIMPH